MRKAGVPVFYDVTGKRKWRVAAACATGFLLLCGATAWVTSSLISRPVLPSPDILANGESARSEDENQDFGGLRVHFDGEGEVIAPKTLRDGTPSGAMLRKLGGGDAATDLRTVLSFDDGPDPVFTPQILDILKEYHAPAVFFVVGKNAEKHPELLKRMIDEGHEIGNHTFSHADLFKISETRQKLELTMTQRVIQTVTGRSTFFFRPPYGGNPTPQNLADIVPISRAAAMGYVTVGEGINPMDWELTKLAPGVHSNRERQPRTPDDIADHVIRSQNEGHIILFHDAGGNRTLTVEALPKIITALRSSNRQFVSLSEFCGTTRDQSMPPVSATEKVMIAGNRAIFAVGLPIQRALGILFVVAMFFGILRIVFLMILVLLQRPREKRRVFSDEFTPTVTVIMAAYNEEKVIVDSVKSLLNSDYPALDIVVVDDGSKDQTLRLLRENFGDEERLQILHQKNAGKMAAMNRALRSAEGEILVLADADTLFPAPAIGFMARHFVDQRVGAVAAAVRIGNAADNVLTRWQALEYCTCQNFDRRGFDLLNCIPVIAGAAGAVRRKAIMALGGFSPDTLNEDMDMTWQLLRAGWRIVNDSDAVAYTEAPNTINNFIRQRFRWAYGTLQCLWKHRDALGHYGALGWIALPVQWLHQVLLPPLSPVVDVLMIYSIFTGHLGNVAFFGLLMLAAEAAAAAVAISMGDGNPRLLPWLPAQRFGYHPFMWYVVAKSIVVAFLGTAVGWNKFARAGTAAMGGDGATLPSEPSKEPAKLEPARQA